MRINKEKESLITQKELKEQLHYDPETGIFMWRVRLKNRDMRHAGHINIYDNGKHYLIIGLYGNSYRAHRLAYIFMEGFAPPDQIDHIDGDGLNNKWSNLRIANSLENAKNRRLRSDNTSGYIGVSWNKRKKKWGAYIKNSGKSVTIGLFANIQDAVDARERESIKYGFHKNHGNIRPL